MRTGLHTLSNLSTRPGCYHVHNPAIMFVTTYVCQAYSGIFSTTGAKESMCDWMIYTFGIEYVRVLVPLTARKAQQKKIGPSTIRFRSKISKDVSKIGLATIERFVVSHTLIIIIKTDYFKKEMNNINVNTWRTWFELLNNKNSLEPYLIFCWQKNLKKGDAGEFLWPGYRKPTTK